MKFDLFTRPKIAALLLIAASLLSSIETLKREAWNYYKATYRGVEEDDARRQEKRLAGIKELLPHDGIVGYVTDQPGVSRDGEYFLTQYSLAPLIVIDDPSLRLVIGDFHRHESAASAGKGMVVIKETDDGILLLKQVESR